jgi:uncharacterized protein
MKIEHLIDAHVHFDCTSEATLAQDQENYRRFRDGMGLDAAMVMAKSTYHIEFFPEHERLLELGQRDDGIFPIINFDVPYADDKCLEACEEWLTKGLAWAVKIYPGYDPFYPHEHPRSLELCAMLERLGKPLMVHTGDTVTKNGRLRYARPIHLDELCVRFPSLSIVMAHIGNPFFDEAQAILYKNDNLLADGSGLFISQTNQFNYDVFAEELINRLRYLYAYIDSAEKIHFGGDFPFTNPGHHVLFWKLVVQNLEFTEWEAHLLFYENARRAFGLPLPAVLEEPEEESSSSAPFVEVSGDEATDRPEGSAEEE